MYSLTPFRRNPGTSLWNPLSTDRFFRSFFDMSDVVSSAGFRVDVRDEGDAFLLEAELPGTQKENIQLSLDDNALVIHAELNSEKKEERSGYLYSERRSGHVERRFQLDGIKSDDISATYENGILVVKLPKVQPQEEEEEARKIEIQ